MSVSTTKKLSFLQPHIVDVVRIGRVNDGGYVIPRYFLQEARLLVTLGIATDWSFERDFVRATCNQCHVSLCDRSSGSWTFVINAIKELLATRNWQKLSLQKSKQWCNLAVQFYKEVRNEGWHFYRRWVVAELRDPRRDISLWQLLTRELDERKTVLKIDIEGGELELLEELLRWNLINKPPIGLIIEFHDVCKKLAAIQDVTEKLAQWYRVVHVHANNYGVVVGGVPDVMEVVFAERELVSEERRQAVPLVGLDHPNNPHEREIPLSWETSGRS